MYFSKKNFDVQSFGTGAQVKLPGPAANRPNVFSFDWRYEDIFAELEKKDRALYPFKFFIAKLLKYITIYVYVEK